MSDDLELPDSPKTVIRTYSNAARTTPGGGGGGPPTRGEQQQHHNSLFLMAINNNMAEAGNNNNNKEEEIEMSSRSSSTVKIEIHNDERNSRWQQATSSIVVPSNAFNSFREDKHIISRS